MRVTKNHSGRTSKLLKWHIMIHCNNIRVRRWKHRTKSFSTIHYMLNCTLPRVCNMNWRDRWFDLTSWQPWVPILRTDRRFWSEKFAGIPETENAELESDRREKDRRSCSMKNVGLLLKRIKLCRRKLKKNARQKSTSNESFYEVENESLYTGLGSGGNRYTNELATFNGLNFYNA